MAGIKTILVGTDFSVAAETALDMGTHGRRGLARALIGSVAESVVRASPVPVLTVHAAPSARRRSSRLCVISRRRNTAGNPLGQPTARPDVITDECPLS